MSEKSYLPSGVFLVCDKGVLPTPLTVTSALSVSVLGAPVATDRDKALGLNIKPFGVCMTTRAPCAYAPTPLGWSPVKDDVEIAGGHPLLEDSQLRCSTGMGCISVFMSLSAAMLGVAANANNAINQAGDDALKQVGDEVSHQFNQADDYLKTLGPPLGDYAREKLGQAEGLLGGAGSLVEGLWGLSKMARNLELKVANGVTYAIEHPAETGQAISQGVQKGWTAATSKDTWLKVADLGSNAIPGVLQAKAAVWLSDPAHREQLRKATAAAWAKASTQLADPRKRGWLEGRIAFEVLLVVLTAGTGEAVNAAGKAGEVANAAGKAGEAVKAADAALATGKVVTGAAEEAAGRTAAKEGAEQAAKELETVEGAGKEASTCLKDPVNVATGAMVFDAIDVELPGPIPFGWVRTWYSTSQRRGPLGHGWHHSYDLALWADATGQLHLRLADGRLAIFAPLTTENDYCAYHRGEQMELRPSDQLGQSGGYAVYALRERLSYYFEPALASLAPIGVQRLARIGDAHNHAIEFSYGPQGQLSSIRDSAGRTISVRSDEAGRMLALDLPASEGSTGTFTAVQYAYDAAGHLTSATDAEGHAAHFAYNARHLLTTKTFRTGASFYFEYDAQRRCTHTWGDENYFNARFLYEEGHTVVLEEEPATRQEYFHHAGLVTRHVDALGQVWSWHYNAYGELELARDPLGQATGYDYNSRGFQVGITYPDGRRVQTQYTDQGQCAQVTDVAGGVWQWQYDGQSQLTARTDPYESTTRYEYDEQGRSAAMINVLGQTTRLRYDAQHNLAHLVTPDGNIRSRTYDALGRLVGLTNARGQVERRRYDRLGQLVEVRQPDGTAQQLAYDEEGQIVRVRDGQQEVELRYTPAGQLAERSQAGQRVRFGYDRAGRLTQLLNEAGEAYRFGLDAAGQVVEVVGFDGLTRRYEHDAAGRVRQVRRPAGRTSAYAYDAAGRVAEVVHNDTERTCYRYDPAGALIEATTEGSTVVFKRDARGRVLTETQNEHTVTSAYDVLGQRVGLTSSLGANVSLERDALGQVSQTRAGSWQSVVGRDAEGLEVQRQLSGGVRTAWQYDALGRPLSQRLTVGAAGRIARQRRYQWQGADQLLAIEDSEYGTSQFRYDTVGNLAGATFADGVLELRQPDAVGNLFRTAAHTDRQYGKGGQLRDAGGTRYRYDEEGNLTRKTMSDGRQWHYAWDGTGQLAKVTRPDGYAITFTYDALGRRISKRFRGRVTHWVWDGDKPLHEWHELEVGLGAGSIQDLTTWLFEDDSFAPAAKLTSQGAQSVVCDHLGTPLTMYDGQGRATWEMSLDSYGGVRQGRGKAQDCPFRYQGQYEDTETGLYYNRFRYYDPEAGQYISQDPASLRGGIKLYAYAHNPNSYVDEFGLLCAEVVNQELRIKQKFPANSAEAQELEDFARSWNQEIQNAGGSMTRQSVPKALRRTASQGGTASKTANPHLYTNGEVPGHTPDVGWGGQPTGPFVPLSPAVNSYVGGATQAVPVGTVYTSVVIVP